MIGPLRIRQLFSNLLTLGTEGRVGGRFETMRLDRPVAAEASTVSAFSDTGQCVVDASGFVDVPVCQTAEQVASAFMRCSIDPLFVFVHRALFLLNMLKRPHDFAATVF